MAWNVMAKRALVVCGAVALTGCISRMAEREAGKRGSGGSILSSVGSIDERYLEDETMRYWLKCNNGLAVLGVILEKGDEKFMSLSLIHI